MFSGDEDRFLLTSNVITNYSIEAELSTFWVDEVIVKRGKCLVWKKGEFVKLQSDFVEKEIWVGWGVLDEFTSEGPIPCVLSKGMIKLCSTSRPSMSIPLVENFSYCAPTRGGILLGGEGVHGLSKLYLLYHHEEEPEEVNIPFKHGFGAVIWSSSNLPILVTHDQENSDVKVWVLKASEAYNAPGLTSTENVLLTPSQSNDMCSPRRSQGTTGRRSYKLWFMGSLDHSVDVPTVYGTQVMGRNILICNADKVTLWEVDYGTRTVRAIETENFDFSSSFQCCMPLEVFACDTMKGSSQSLRRQFLLGLSFDGSLYLLDARLKCSRQIKLKLVGETGHDMLMAVPETWQVPQQDFAAVIGNPTKISEPAGSNFSIYFENGTKFRARVLCFPMSSLLVKLEDQQGIDLWESSFDLNSTQDQEWLGIAIQGAFKFSARHQKDDSKPGAYGRLECCQEHLDMIDDLGWDFDSTEQCVVSGITAENVHRQAMISVLDQGLANELFKCQNVFYGGLLQHENEEDPSEGGVRSMHSGSTGGIIKIFTIVNDTIKSLLSAENDEEKEQELKRGSISLLNLLTNQDWSLQDVKTLPPFLSIPVQHLLRVASLQANMRWDPKSLVLTDRFDLIANKQYCQLSRKIRDHGDAESRDKQRESWNLFELESEFYNPHGDNLVCNRKSGGDIDPLNESMQLGVDGLSSEVMEHRFGDDTRLLEARAMLSTNEPVPLTGSDTDDASERSFWEQTQLKIFASRTLALPLGRGALALCTHRALPTEPLRVPDINLSGRLPDRNDAIIKLDLSSDPVPAAGGALSETTAWPEFHNGVSAALRLAPGGKLSRTWIVYNKPPDPSYQHAGVLLGLGLTGQLSCLAMTDLYRYLSQEHEATLVGVLLGMSASKRGSMDSILTKILFLHLPARHPVGYPDLEISPVVQSSAFLGLGLLYKSSGQRSIIEILLQEMERSSAGDRRSQKEAQDSTKSSEAYTLSAGFALGLVCLCKGTEKALDLDVESKLQYLMIGSTRSGNISKKSTFVKSSLDDGHFSHSEYVNDLIVSELQSSRTMPSRTSGAVAEELAAAQGAARTVLEGDLINLNATSPAAAISLGLMYLKSNNKRVADMFYVPDSHFSLRLVNPEHLCNRILLRSLVMWDSVTPTEDWIRSQLPDILQDPFRRSPKIDISAVSQSHFFVLSGACLAVGLKFAGSGNQQAFDSVRAHLLYFLNTKNKAIKQKSHYLNREVLESCITSSALSISMIMAGTGDLRALSTLRGLLKRAPKKMEQVPQMRVHYGSYSAIALGIGLLFLGGGRLSLDRSSEAVAYLLISMYPSLAKSPRDNSSYLQAFRHLYVLAAKEQGVDVIDVRSNRYIKKTLDSSDDIIGLQYINSTLHTFENPTVSSMLQDSFMRDLEENFDILGTPDSIRGYAHATLGGFEASIDALVPNIGFENTGVRCNLLDKPGMLAAVIQILRGVKNGCHISKAQMEYLRIFFASLPSRSEHNSNSVAMVAKVLRPEFIEIALACSPR